MNELNDAHNKELFKLNCTQHNNRKYEKKVDLQRYTFSHTSPLNWLMFSRRCNFSNWMYGFHNELVGRMESTSVPLPELFNAKGKDNNNTGHSKHGMM